jgi:thioredoxin-like negative regulator of GroEL
VLEVRALPTFVLLRDGAEVCRLEGAPQRRPARALAQALRAHLGEAAAPATGRGR